MMELVCTADSSADESMSAKVGIRATADVVEEDVLKVGEAVVGCCLLGQERSVVGSLHRAQRRAQVVLYVRSHPLGSNGKRVVLHASTLVPELTTAYWAALIRDTMPHRDSVTSPGSPVMRPNAV